jgi:hypothetical protein
MMQSKYGKKASHLSPFFHDDAAVDRLLYSKEPEYSNWRREFPDSLFYCSEFFLLCVL